jgi:hypothetical protein
MEGGRAHPSGPQEGEKNGPISGAIIKRLDGGLNQEWRRREPVRESERQIERLRKQRVKVISCQRPLLLPLYKALAQPKQRVYDNIGADAFKPLICICLVVVYEGGEAERRRPRGAMKCRILHIRCKPGVCKPGVGGRASGLRRVAAPSDQPERAENRCRREKRRRKPGK